MTTSSIIESDPLITAITSEIEMLRNQRREHYKTQSQPLSKRFSQEELSDYAYPSYKNLLIGRTRRLPDRATLLRIADYLECSFEERQKLLHAAQYAPEAPRSQQRKQITIVIADLSLSPALLALEDVEESTELLQSLWLRYDALIISGRGIVVKHVGTRLIAVWSAETTREDDPYQAVRTALRLCEATAMIAQERGLAQRHHDRAGQAAALLELGGLELRINQLHKARQVVMQALEIQMVIGDVVGMYTSQLLLGLTAAQGGDHKTAQEYYRQAWDQAVRLEDAYLMTHVTITEVGL